MQPNSCNNMFRHSAYLLLSLCLAGSFQSSLGELYLGPMPVKQPTMSVSFLVLLMKLHLRATGCHLPYHMGSCSVTFHPTQVNTPHLNPSQTGRYSIYLPRRDRRLSLPSALFYNLLDSQINATCSDFSKLRTILHRVGVEAGLNALIMPVFLFYIH